MKITKIERCMYCGAPESDWPFGGCTCWTDTDAVGK